MDNFEHVIARWEISILTHFKTYFTACSSVFMDNFEHVIARWEISILTHFKTMFHSSPPENVKKTRGFQGV